MFYKSVDNKGNGWQVFGLIAIMLVLTTMPSNAGAIYPEAGFYDGQAIIQSFATPASCSAVTDAKVGDTYNVKLEYPGSKGSKLRLWQIGTAPKNVSIIDKMILQVTNGLGSLTPSGNSTSVSYDLSDGRQNGITGFWSAKMGFFDETSFTMLFNYSLPTSDCTVTSSFAFVRSGALSSGG